MRAVGAARHEARTVGSSAICTQRGSRRQHVVKTANVGFEPPTFLGRQISKQSPSTSIDARLSQAGPTVTQPYPAGWARTISRS